MKIHSNQLTTNSYKAIREKDRVEPSKVCIKSLKSGKFTVQKRKNNG